jgi:glycosyltransferase involved in cell wall biosynthesis
LKISIITATYNCNPILIDCLNSVALQSYNNIEHIIIDGASTDGTLPLINSKRDQISVLVSEPDNGIYDAMNKGIKLATGNIIGFLNSDDFYANNEIISKVAIEFKRDPYLDVCYADLIYVNKLNSNKNIRYFKSSKFKQGLFSKGWCPPHPTFFVRRSAYERYGSFDLNYRIASDFDLMMRFLEIHKIKSRYIPEVWVKMRMGGVSNKNLKNIWLQNREILNSLQRNGLKVNPIIFFVYKIVSRFQQFFERQRHS